MNAPHFPKAADLPADSLLFMDGPVWIGVRIDGVDGAAILAAFDRLRRLVAVAASKAPRSAAVFRLRDCEAGGCSREDCVRLDRCCGPFVDDPTARMHG